MNNPKTRNENIVVQEMEQEILIYDLQTNKAFCLNETSAMIYNLCDGKRNVAEISQHLKQKLNQPITEDLIWLALNELKREGLLENDSETERFLDSVSRRELVKKAGLASMIALPVITGLVAPKAADAASGVPIALFGACPSGSGCATGLTCRSCFGCTPSVTVLSCCSNPNGGRGPGLNPSVVCVPASICPIAAANNCCSGTATHTVTGCNGFPSNGDCICN